MELYIGTSGFSYKEWKGPFYPEDLPNTKMLNYYGERFNSVEINNTFYRMPKKDTLRKWTEDVPDGFLFVLKASRRITHIKRLKETEELLGYLFGNAEVLGAKRGLVFFQLPPFFRKDAARLQTFLQELPKDEPVAFEFRHKSWFDEEVYELLRAHGAAWCIVDQDTEDLGTPFISTADWGYLRLRKPGYTDDDLREWAERIKSEQWQRVFMFFKHEDAGAGPKLAERFREIF